MKLKISSCHQINRVIIWLIKKLSDLFNLDLLPIAYNKIGILKYNNLEVTGEKYFIENVLSKLFPTDTKTVYFDVGANTGNYSLLLRNSFPNAEIWSFEPNLFTYQKLKINTSAKNVTIKNLALGKQQGTKTLYYQSSNTTSSAASIHKEIFSNFYHTDALDNQLVTMYSLDSFCKENKIENIDLLKIDTEGSEIEVLLGAQQLLEAGKIKVIQFEFGECHVFSRTFLLDFYKILKDFKFYRLDSRRIIPLGVYNVCNEIFRFQNIIAIHNNLLVSYDHQKNIP